VPLEVTGRITARLYVSSDCPDTDFTVKLTDVYPDGRSDAGDGWHPASAVPGVVRKRELLEPDEVVEIPVDLWSTSLVFNTGHRLRIAISSSNSPRFDPNPNTGHAFRTDREQRVATNMIHFSDKHPSHIVLPCIGEPALRTSIPP